MSNDSRVIIDINGDKRVITTNSHAWISAKHQGIDDDGRIKLGRKKYYKDFHLLVKGLIRDGLRDSDFSTMIDIKQNLETIYQTIEEELEVNFDLDKVASE